MINFIDALIELRPNSEWSLSGSNYKDLIWNSTDTTQPTEEEIQAKIAELEAAEPMRLLREERDRRLAATDWRATIDYPGDDQAAWLEYRQSLRDITLQDPENVTWPEEPA